MQDDDRATRKADLISARIAELNAKAERTDPLALTDLLSLMVVLRDPHQGCPWDREQDFTSIAPYTIEEAYEVADAIARADLHDLKDELGDLLLQVVYHAQMAEEAEEFDFHAIADAVTRKMIRRHPHVFGDEETKAAQNVPGMWDRIKAEEAKRKEELNGGRSSPESALDGVPLAFPALTRSVKLQKRAAKVGFDWGELPPILDKLREELGELEEEIKVGDQAKIQEEFGDLLFVMANLGRRLSLDPEQALSETNRKFMRRFSHIETRLSEMGRNISEASLPEMEELWNEAKLRERSG